MIPNAPPPGLAAEFGVGGALPGNCGRTPRRTPPARSEIVKAGDEECRPAGGAHARTAGRRKTEDAGGRYGETLGGNSGALFDWLAACLERGSVEEYEFRVSCY